MFFFAFLILAWSFSDLIVSKSLPHNEQYSIIFDAGSKNTRMYIFKYVLNPYDSNDFTIEQKEFCELKDGGLSTYTDPSDVKAKFEVCMTRAAEIVPLEKKATTPISLAATAGMRLLKIKNETAAENVLGYVRSYFQSTGYFFINDNQVRIISGQEEGLFAWISANYLSKAFNNNQPTSGIVEIGGSSAQITYASPSNSKTDFSKPSDFFMDVKIAGKTFNVYSYSFLCFGTTAIYNMYSMSQLKANNYMTSKASCLPDGYDFEFLGADILDQPCLTGQIFDQSHDFTIDSQRIEVDQIYTVKGNSKKNKCRDEIAQMMPNPSCPFGQNQCSFNGVFQPDSLNTKFFALGNIFESIDQTERLFQRTIQHDMNAFNQTTYDICSMTYAQLKDLNIQSNADISKSKLRTLCLNNVYIMKFLSLLRINNLKDVTAVETINNSQVSWILGYLVYDLNNGVAHELNK